MVKHEIRATSYEVRATVTSYQLRVINPQVMSSNLQLTSSNLQVTSSNPRIIKSMKFQVSCLKVPHFLRLFILKLVGNSWGNLYVQFLMIISCFNDYQSNPWLPLQQEAEWVNINFERRHLNFPQKSHPPPTILEKIAFSFALNLRKQNMTGFYFMSLTQNIVLCY